MRFWKLGSLFFCMALAGAPVAAQEPSLEFVFEEIVTLGDATAPGDTARGGRLIIPITGGTFEGPDMRGVIVPGGWDWQLRRADGCTEVEADYFLETDDGVVINVVNTGVICAGEGGAMQPVRTHPVFEAPRGKYEWMSQTAFVGTLEPAPPSAGPAVKIRFYRVR
jgi:hypothetical protein